MRPETRAALFNNYLKMSDGDVRFKAIDTVIESIVGDSIVDALSVAPTSGDSRLDSWRNYAYRENSEKPLKLAAELLVAESIMMGIASVANEVPGVIE